MKIWKRFAAGLLTAALTLSLLTACGDSGGGSNGGGNSGNANPPAASTGGQDNESSSDSTIQEPDKRSHGQILKRMHILAAWV